MATNLPRPLPNYNGAMSAQAPNALYQALQRPPQRGLASGGGAGQGMNPRQFQRKAKYGKAWDLAGNATNQMPGKQGKAPRLD